MEDIIAACLALGSHTLEPSDEPLWLLGKQYDTNTEMEEVKKDFISRIWLTYRCNFPPLTQESGMTSDRGWGCMLRCAQMLLAEAMSRRHLGREWRWDLECKHPDYLQLVNMFEDKPEVPFSLHSMVTVGEYSSGKKIGEWYGPHTVARVVKELRDADVWNNFGVIIGCSNILFVDEMKTRGKYSHPNGWDPLLIIVPLRLGINEFSERYIELLQKYFQIPYSLGVLGGSPSHALFIVGYVGDCAVYLDPHTTQHSCRVGKKETEVEMAADGTYHCGGPLLMPIKNLDPSMAVCFLVNKECDFDDFVSRLRADLCTGRSFPLIEVMDTRPDYMKDDDNYIPPKTVEQLHRHKYEHCHGQQLDSPSASMDAEIKGQPSDLDDSNEEDFEML